MSDLPKRRRFLIRANRHSLKVTIAAAVSLYVLGFLLGWAFASLVVAAAGVGYQAGHGTGFKHGLDHSYANVLRDDLEKLHFLEQAMAESGDLAPDSEERVQIAKLRGELIEELRRVA